MVVVREGASQGRLTEAERFVPRKHGWNLAVGQMGILSTREGGVECVLDGREGRAVVVVGGGSWCQSLPQLSLAERCICDVNMWGADENMHLKQR